MNRKNRKEKEQNTDVSKQICVHKTQNTLLEFNSFLRMAEPKDFWHLHEDIASDYSRIRAVMVDYSKEDSISVYANLSPEIIKYVYSRIWNNVQEFKFFQQKIFCEDRFKQQVNCTCIEYLLHYRLKISQELLSNTNLKIDDIATQCGFKYSSYFNRQFTKCLGITPSEFRKNPTGYSMFEGEKISKL